MSVRSVILESIVRIAAQQKKTLAPLTDSLPLLDSGLDSLCIAVLVASLDESLAIDPFDREDDISFPVTIGEFIALYEHADAYGTAPPPIPRGPDGGGGSGGGVADQRE
jgi:acyl carrier protein